MSKQVSDVHILQERGYKLTTKLGEGGYAKVYLCEFSSKKSKQTIKLACKVINIVKEKKSVLKFLQRELKILSKINHPHIIRIHSIFYLKSKYFIFMRHAEKGDLLDYILSAGPIEETQARFWVRQMSLALQYLHILEIAHRDMKCENILITAHNNVQLADFGFARSVINEQNKRELSETYCGSISYAPPEIIKSEAPYNPKQADIWSFGVLIYTMLNKGNPFDSNNLKVFHENQIKKNWKFRSKYTNRYSKEAKDLVTRMLEPKPENRYKIEEIIHSAWIAMDRDLKSLSASEYKAFTFAATEAKSAGISKEPYEGYRKFETAMSRINSHRKSLVTIKDYSSAFNLQLINSDWKFAARLSLWYNYLFN